MSTPILKTLFGKSENKDKFQKKRDTLPFWTFSCKILIKSTSVELRLFFYFKGNGIQHVKSVLKYISFNPIQCSGFLR